MTTTPLVRRPLQVVETDGIRRFDNGGLQRAIDRAIKAKAADHKVAAVAHADMEGASVSLLVKLGDAWSISAGAYKPWNGSLTAEAQVVWSPF